jgi:hypothetical protein
MRRMLPETRQMTKIVTGVSTAFAEKIKTGNPCQCRDAPSFGPKCRCRRRPVNNSGPMSHFSDYIRRESGLPATANQFIIENLIGIARRQYSTFVF